MPSPNRANFSTSSKSILLKAALATDSNSEKTARDGSILSSYFTSNSGLHV